VHLVRQLAQSIGRVEVLGVILTGLFLILSGLSHQFVYGQGHLERPILAVVAWLLAAFLIYGMAVWIVLRRPQAVRLSTVLLFAVLFRLMLLGSNVIQEDDLYRYVWDGQVSLQGVSPYRYAPTEAGTPPSGVADGSAEERSPRPADIPVELAALRDVASSHPGIVTRVNHPGVPTIYPPVAQAVFALTQWAVPWSLRGVRVMSVVFDGLCVLLVIAILRQLALPLSRVLIYAWSPLVLKEFANSGHMDTIAMTMVLLSLLLLLRRRWSWAGATLALAVASKYYPLVLAPVIGQRVWQERRGVFHRWAVAFLGTLALCFAPLIGDELRVFRGLGIYAGTWELNAGLFGVVQNFARIVAGDVAPYATRLLLSGLIIAALVWSLRRPPAVRDDIGLLARCVFVIGVLFLLSPVQTPWYLCWLVPLLCVVPSRAWLLLSGLILCYYLGFFVEYHYPEPQRSIFWNAVKALEYAPFFGLVLWQWVRQRQQVSDENRRMVDCARPALAASAVPRAG